MVRGVSMAGNVWEMAEERLAMLPFCSGMSAYISKLVELDLKENIIGKHIEQVASEFSQPNDGYQGKSSKPSRPAKPPKQADDDKDSGR